MTLLCYVVRISVHVNVVELPFDERLQHLEELFKVLVTCKLASAQMRYANLSCVYKYFEGTWPPL